MIQIESKIDNLGKEDNPNDSAAEGETASCLSWSRSIILVILKVLEQYQTAPRLGVYAWLDSASRAEEYQSLQYKRVSHHSAPFALVHVGPDTYGGLWPYVFTLYRL